MGNNVAVAGTAKIGAGALVPFLTENADKIAEAATFKIDTRKAIQVCATICASEKNRRMLADCTNASFLNALRQCVSFGLMPTPATDMGYFIPYKDKATGATEVQFKLGWRGILELARRSGVHAVAKVVYKGDRFAYKDGLNPEITHEPDLTGPRGNGDVVCAYCEAVWTGEDGAPRKAVEVMTKAEIDTVRSKAAEGSGAWKDFYAEMARKTVLRRASKWWPLSTEAVEAIGVDAEGEFDFSKPVRIHAESPADAVAPEIRETVEAEVIDDDGAKKPFTAEVKAKMLAAIEAAQTLERTYQIEERFGAYDVPPADLAELNAAVKKQIELFNAFGA